MRNSCLSILPESESLGVIGIDGKEYPVPTDEEVKKVFASNKKLVIQKMRQGFNRLQLTPLAMSITGLANRLADRTLIHAKEGKIFKLKNSPDDPEIPVEVDRTELIWINERLKKQDAEGIIYFPTTSSHWDDPVGMSKAEITVDDTICGIPGWSVGLIESEKFVPGKIDKLVSPIKFLPLLSTPDYNGETGWTSEDYLIYSLALLSETNQVPYEGDRLLGEKRAEVTWLMGTYLPQERGVPRGFWSDDGHYYIGVVTWDIHTDSSMRTMVRLGKEADERKS